MQQISEHKAVDAGSSAARPPILKLGVAIYLTDGVSRRMVESAAIQLNLEPVILSDLNLATGAFTGLGLLIVEATSAKALRRALRQGKLLDEGLDPAIIAVYPPRQHGEALPKETALYDGVLFMPMHLAELTAKISLVLYAHKTLVARYQTAFEELHLNRLIFRSVTCGVSVSSASQTNFPLVYVNPAFEMMTGYSFEEVQGRNCRFLQKKANATEAGQPQLDANGLQNERSLELVRQAIREGRECSVVLLNYRKDGTPFWNELALSPIRNREGVLTHIVGIQTDITERVEFEAALRQSEKLAAVGRLASSIAHEINNPLASVMNLLYLAQGTDALPQIREFLALADKEVQRVALITSQSLRFYRQSSRPLSVCSHDVLSSVLSMYDERTGHAGIGLVRRDRTSPPIICLESEIRQVLNNLVRNALDAMPGKGGRLLVRSRAATDWRSGQQGVLMTIADTGTGMSETTMKQIYKPFFTTKDTSGTGLGLWISGEIVARHHGRLRVRSSQKPGASGTVFLLFLPLDMASG